MLIKPPEFYDDEWHQPSFEHDVGDTKCSSCWIYYPELCSCGGLIHADFGEENEDMEYCIFTQCDKCGKNGFG
jgi:hypothetical protein